MQITTIGLDIAKHVFQVHGNQCQREGCCSEATSAQPGTGVAEAQLGTTTPSAWGRIL